MRFLLGIMKNVLKLIVVMDDNSMNVLKATKLHTSNR